MHVEIRRRPGEDVQLQHLRAAAVLRGVPARPPVHRAAGHHRAHLRDLPGRLPDELRASAIEDACGVTSTPSVRELRRLLYCGEWIESHALHVYLLHAPDFLGYESAYRPGPRAPRDRRARAAAEEGRQRADASCRRPRDPPGQRARRRLLPGPDRAELAPLARTARTGARLADARCLGRVLPIPGFRARLRVRRAAAPDTYAIRAGGSFQRRSGHRGRRVRRSTSSRSRSHTPPPCIRTC